MNEAISDLLTCLGHVIKLKDGQKEAVEYLTRGRDVFAVLPTGYGKCLIFQLFIKMSASTRPGVFFFIDRWNVVKGDLYEHRHVRRRGSNGV
jgi:superfamily II DNA helicase RecQ